MKIETVVYTAYVVLATVSVGLRINMMVKEHRRHKKAMASVEKACETMRNNTAAMQNRKAAMHNRTAAMRRQLDTENTFEMA